MARRRVFGLPLLIAMLFGIYSAGNAATPQAAPGCGGRLVYFASMARAPGAGITAARFDSASGQLCPLGQMAAVENPTWTIVDPARPILYALSETRGEGRGVWAFRIDAGSGALRLINHVDAGGAEPTFLSMDARSRTLFAAHWGSGEISALPIGDDGAVGLPTSVQRDTGSGPKQPQSGPRAHAAVLDPTGKVLAGAGFGTDRLLLYRFDAATRQLAPADPPFVPLPPGSGPRHLVFDRTGRFLYLVSQLSSEIRVFDRIGAASGPLLVQALSTLAPEFVGANDAAEIALSADGRFLYISNRGDDTIVAYAVDPRTGRLTARQRMACGGKTPRSFTIDPSGRWLLVANQNSDEVAVFSRDVQTGMLRPSDIRLKVPGVVGITFVTAESAAR